METITKGKWKMARFCKGCDSELSQNEYMYSDCCPDCGSKCSGMHIPSYTRVRRKVTVVHTIPNVIWWMSWFFNPVETTWKWEYKDD